MKKMLIVGFLMLFFMSSTQAKVISNEKIDYSKVYTAQKIITQLQNEMQNYTKDGSGPFVAAIYDSDNNLIVKVSNSVVNENCSNNHAEMNAIKAAEQKLETYDLSKYNLKLYVTSEPCMMCIGGIMWSGIRELYYGVPSKSVEKITGFDEGFKPHWFKEFKKRGIIVYGNIEPKLGEEKLTEYIKKGEKVYKPSR